MPSLRLLAALVASAVALVLPAVAGAAGLSGSEASLLREINRVRALHGLQPLAYDPRLTRAARAHTREMTADGVFEHGAFAARMERFHVAARLMAENLAWGTGALGTARGIVEAWLASPSHRENLLHAGFRRIGLGAVQTTFLGMDDASVVTADFAGS